MNPKKSTGKPFVFILAIAVIAVIAYFMLRGSSKPEPNKEEAKGANPADETPIVDSIAIYTERSQDLRLVVISSAGACGKPRTTDEYFDIVILVRMISARWIERKRIERARVLDAAINLSSQMIVRTQHPATALNRKHFQSQIRRTRFPSRLYAFQKIAINIRPACGLYRGNAVNRDARFSK